MQAGWTKPQVLTCARIQWQKLNHPELEQIADNGRALIEKEFTYEKTVEKYRNILDRLK